MEQRYVSDELTHFVGRKLVTDTNATQKQYELLIGIIKSGKLGIEEASSVNLPYDIDISANLHEMKGMVCLCDIPVSELGLHMMKYSRMGMAFKKPFLTAKGANPVFYVATRSREFYGKQEWVNRGEIFKESFRRLICLFRDGAEKGANCKALKDRIVDINNSWGFLYFHLFNYMKFFDDGLDMSDSDNYYMEREWRLRGPIDFNLTDICRIIVPEGFKEIISQDLPDYTGDITLV